MNRFFAIKGIFLTTLFLLGILLKTSAQIIPIGSGSYTTQLPPADAAGRNNKPAGIPRVSGLAANKAIPTNDWWTGLLSFTNANLYDIDIMHIDNVYKDIKNKEKIHYILHLTHMTQNKKK